MAHSTLPPRPYMCLRSVYRFHRTAYSVFWQTQFSNTRNSGKLLWKLGKILHRGLFRLCEQVSAGKNKVVLLRRFLRIECPHKVAVCKMGSGLQESRGRFREGTFPITKIAHSSEFGCSWNSWYKFHYDCMLHLRMAGLRCILFWFICLNYSAFSCQRHLTLRISPFIQDHPNICFLDLARRVCRARLQIIILRLRLLGSTEELIITAISLLICNYYY